MRNTFNESELALSGKKRNQGVGNNNNNRLPNLQGSNSNPNLLQATNSNLGGKG